MNDKNEEQKKADEIAMSLGFDHAIYLGTFKEENIYMPALFDVKEPCIGKPRFLHAKKGKFRWSKNYSEGFEVADYFSD